MIEIGLQEQGERVTKPTPLLMFANGPVMDSISGIRASDANTPVGQERLPLWSENMAKAAVILHKRGVVKEVAIMGGKTGGPQYASESRLIRAMLGDEFPEEQVKIEEASLDTAQNIVNFLNEDELPNAPLATRTIDILGASYHINRLRLYAKLFGLHVRHIYAAEEVIRFDARSGDDGTLTDNSDPWNGSVLTMIEQMVDMNRGNETLSPPNPFYKDKQGVEKMEMRERALYDNLWVRELLEYPERLMAVIVEVNNDARVREMVKIQEYVHGQESLVRLGIDANADIDSLRAALRKVTWPFMTPAEKDVVVNRWKEETTSQWPESITDKYDRLMNYSPLYL